MTDWLRLATEICHPLLSAEEIAGLTVVGDVTLLNGPAHKAERPAPEWVRGACPFCGEEVVSNAYYVGGRGYLIRMECWASLGESPTCEYRRVL